LQHQIVSLRSQESLCQARPFDHWWYGWCKVHGQQTQKRGYHLQFLMFFGRIFYQTQRPQNKAIWAILHTGFAAFPPCFIGKLSWCPLTQKSLLCTLKLTLARSLMRFHSGHQVAHCKTVAAFFGIGNSVWELRGLLNVLKHAQKGDISNPPGLEA